MVVFNQGRSLKNIIIVLPTVNCVNFENNLLGIQDSFTRHRTYLEIDLGSLSKVTQVEAAEKKKMLSQIHY